MSLFRRSGILALAAFALLGGRIAPPVAAQAAQGSIQGTAHSAEDAQPLRFSLVRLLPLRSDSASPRGTITDAQGRFRFEGVAAGEYRLQLELIGYQRTLSPVLRVEPGASLRHEIRGAMEPIQLEGITAYADGTCLGASQLSEDPALTALWDEARKGMETRRAFERKYRFTRSMRQEVNVRRRLMRTSRVQQEDTVVSEPDSVVARDQRRREERRTHGYLQEGPTGFVLQMPNEKDLLDDEFLADHCLEASVDGPGGAVGVRFRPVEARRDRTDIRGTIWLDPKSFLIQRLEVDYIKGKQSVAESSVQFADIRVGESTVRLPASGTAVGRPSGLLGLAIPEARILFTIAYRDFQRTGTESDVSRGPGTRPFDSASAPSSPERSPTGHGR